MTVPYANGYVSADCTIPCNQSLGRVAVSDVVLAFTSVPTRVQQSNPTFSFSSQSTKSASVVDCGAGLEYNICDATSGPCAAGPYSPLTLTNFASGTATLPTPGNAGNYYLRIRYNYTTSVTCLQANWTPNVVGVADNTAWPFAVSNLTPQIRIGINGATPIICGQGAGGGGSACQVYVNDSLTAYAYVLGVQDSGGTQNWSAPNASPSSGSGQGFSFSYASASGTTRTLTLSGYGGTVSQGIDVNTVPVVVNPTANDIRALAINPSTPSILYAGTDCGLFKSVDSGGTWVANNTGLTNTFVQALAINSSSPSTLYAGTRGGGVFKSVDSGATWVGNNTGLTNTFVQALAIDPSNPSALYAGTNGGGIFKSIDSGGSWAVNNTSPTNILALAINPSNPSMLYAGTNGFGVFKSIDSGATWVANNTGLPISSTVRALGHDPIGATTLYAGLAYGSVWQFTSPGFRTLNPCRVIDTRNATGPDAGAPALAGSETRTVATATKCGIPATATAISVNTTITAPSTAGFLMLYAADMPRPQPGSSINFTPAQTRANNGIIRLATDSTGFKVFNGSNGTVHFILDVNGWFE